MAGDEMPALLNNMPSDKDVSIWEVMSCLHGKLIPVAAFSQSKYAEMLSLYLKPTNEPLDPDPNWDDDNDDDDEKIVLSPFFRKVYKTVLELDKYLPELEAGEMPFDITIKKNGDVFRAKRAETLFETDITTYYGVEQLKKASYK